jgi:hypothetical protein
VSALVFAVAVAFLVVIPQGSASAFACFSLSSTPYNSPTFNLLPTTTPDFGRKFLSSPLNPKNLLKPLNLNQIKYLPNAVNYRVQSARINL